jgi:DNA repair exonuclease SbcCD nuclease subunit
MARTLVIGDVHATPQDLADCEALWRLVIDSVQKYDCANILLLGDQHHTHDVMNTRVINFWKTAFKHYGYTSDISIVATVGNHDFCNVSSMHPHAMISYEDVCNVVDTPTYIAYIQACVMPYYANPVEFIEEAVKLKELNPEVKTLFCHQTFTGADGGLGFFSKDAVEPSAVPFKRIVSGHIHRPMQLGKVFYVGAPRWKTLSDAEVEQRHIYVWEEGKAPIGIPTNSHCTRIYKFEDSEASPINIQLTEDELTRADIRITVSGTSDYISKRMTELKGKYNAKCRGVPVRNRLVKASESEGILNAFQRFGNAFNAPNGTDKELLLKEAYGRLQVQ